MRPTDSRILAWTTSAALALLLVACPTARMAAAEQRASDKTIRALIDRAGNVDDDEARLAILKQLHDLPGLSESLKADVDKLVLQVNRYVHDRHLPYFGRQAHLTKDYDFKIAETSPLYPLTYLYRGRMVVWVMMESGGIWSVPRNRREYGRVARRFFQLYAERFPENRIARMYLGTPIPSDKHYDAPAGAPKWAVLQREGLERLTDIIEWWIDNRMQPDGQYGGGWGDDCEMWRWWVPILVGFDSPKIGGAQAKFSEALLSRPHMRGGFTANMSDVEHTAEDSADAMTPMMHIQPDNDVWRKRAIRLGELMRTLWTGRNQRGFLQFKSTYFTVDRVDSSPRRACDTVYHPRTVQPTLLYWQRTADADLTKLFSAWMDTWVDATARSERGKPAGIMPSTIHWPDGRVGGLGKDWWDPRNHGENTLYRWPSAMSMVTHTLVLTHHMTGRDKYLEPIRSMARARLKYLDSPVAGPAPGTEAWCASRLGFLSGAVAKYTFLTGGKEFDELLEREMSSYMRFRMRGDREGLVSSLDRNARALRINFPGYTSEVRYTDRVLRFPALFGGGTLFDKGIRGFSKPSVSLLYSTVTGDPGSIGYFPLNAVRWLTPPRDLAAMVTDSGTKRFAAELYHFGKTRRSMSAELYLLAKGFRTLTITANDGGKTTQLTSRKMTVKGPRTRIPFELPPRRLCVLRVE